ncbi:MAG TPA: hypothetical protein VIM49_03540 [Dermatophilaceae bacterium]
MAAIAAPTIPVPSRVTVVVLAVAVIVLLRSLGRSRAVSSLLDRGAGGIGSAPAVPHCLS